MDKRIYVVTDSETYNPLSQYENVRLVNTTHPSRAVSHVAIKRFDVRVATQDDLVEMVGAGLKVEAIE